MGERGEGQERQETGAPPTRAVRLFCWPYPPPLPSVSGCSMPKARIVVVEDEPAIRRGVSDALRLSGYDVTEAADGVHGLREGAADGVDLVLLDLLLPRRDGLDVLAELRRTCPTRPVIILTARGTEEDRVRGLKLGADDYVVKPFSARELLARVEAVLRRALPR